VPVGVVGFMSATPYLLRHIHASPTCHAPENAPIRDTLRPYPSNHTNYAPRPVSLDTPIPPLTHNSPRHPVVTNHAQTTQTALTTPKYHTPYAVTQGICPKNTQFSHPFGAFCVKITQSEGTP